MSSHGYTWNDVRSVPVGDLAVGDVFVQPGAGVAYYVADDGRVRGAGLAVAMELDGTAWTVTARDGSLITMRSGDGREISEVAPTSARVLRVKRTEAGR
jgi:hypothetical protein